MPHTAGAGAIFFALVNITIALVVGFIARRFDFRKWYVALATGILLSIVAPLIGTAIAVAVYGGLNGSGMDLVILRLRASGESVFASTFTSRITVNFIDKIITCMLVMFLIGRLPNLSKLMKKGKSHAA